MKHLKKFEMKYGNTPLSYDIDKELDDIEREIENKIPEVIKIIKTIYLTQNDLYLPDELKLKLNEIILDFNDTNKLIRTILNIRDYSYDNNYREFDRKIFIVVKYIIDNIKFDNDKLDIMNVRDLVDSEHLDLFIYLGKIGFFDKINIKLIYYLSGMIGSNLGHSGQYPYYFMYVFMLDKLPKYKIKEYEKEYGKLKTKKQAHDQIMYMVNYPLH